MIYFVKMSNNYYTILYLLLICTCIYAFEQEMTVHIDAGKIECFFQHAKQGHTIDIEYQVIDGGHGDLDINFALADPIGMILVNDFKKPENIHRLDVAKEGPYRFCFDNSFSMFNRKTVFFELIIDEEGVEHSNDILDGLTSNEYYDMAVQDIMDIFGRIRIALTKARQLQDVLRSHEARDRNLAEANFQMVNAWSIFQILAMIVVGLLQVFMVRSIFDSGTRLSKLWQKFGL
ncbi:transmembrane emp24 domain-containing protein 5-like [Teleopsis dalmanni]|uniref:transmembrane emp24 domain-containing protein 5-like n=1 Tax=Teleopsis dalmanni TaxID=139649 RepID=UPI0018CFD23E|nr:transmembrane emp24 domain-containing protein 5-like [Teleopsis dalmanni]XP_037939773.1 transmembrane emp24 domain-containing protein 5-like [Teleopsis dalmanni]